MNSRKENILIIHFISISSDITKMPSQAKNSPNVQNSPQETPGPRGQQRKVQQKKKKKGGKW